MAEEKKLARFLIVPGAEGRDAQLTVEDDSGDTLELTATREQLELLADTLDDILAANDEADEVKDEDDEGED